MDGKIFTGKYYLLVVLIIFFCSCSNNSNNDTVFRALNESLENSNRTISRSTETISKSLQEKLSDPVIVRKAEIWYPKTQAIRRISKHLFDCIDSLKTLVNAGTRLSNKQVSELFKELLRYKTDLMNVDSTIKFEFENYLLITSSSIDSIKDGQSESFKSFFSKLAREAEVAMLSKVQNNIRLNENKILSFCSSRFAVDATIYNWPTLVANINSNNVKIGDEIRVTAGVAAMTSYPGTEILINGKNISIHATGVAEYAFKTEKIGKHFVTVRISFIDQDGKKQIVSKPIQYTVTE